MPMPEAHCGAYSKLDVAKKEIRLFDLHAGLPDEPLVGTLRRASILNPCRYEALSWCWGPSQQDPDVSTSTVVLHFEPMQIRSNLGPALRTLRYANAPRTLWIDAICINQSQVPFSLQEKEQQVQLMADIYRSAERVLIWLGPEIGLISRALATLETLASPRASDLEALLAIREAQEEPWERSDGSFGSSIGECTMLQWLIWVSHFPYWRRVWVVQEVALASSAALVCGKQYLEFEDLIRAYERMHKLELELTELDPNVYPAMSNIDQSLGLFRDCRRQLANGCNTHFHMQSTSSDYGCFVPRQDFVAFAKLLTICRGQLSTDPRDKIYGLLGLGSKALRSRIQPQYSTETPQVFRNFAQIILQESRSLFTLSQAVKYCFEDESARSDTPSWLPCWTAQKGRMIEYEQAKYRLRQEMLFYACGAAEAEHLEFKNDELRLSGIVIDRISSAKTFSRWQEGRYVGVPNLDFLQIWSQKSRQKVNSTAGASPLLEGQDQSLAQSTLKYIQMQGEEVESIFWRTWAHDQEPCGDRKEFQRCGTGFFLKCELWREEYVRWVQAGRDVHSWRGPSFSFFNNDLWQGTDKVLYHSRFFISEDGFLGLAGRHIMPGDRICVLAGGRLPFVLRPLEPNADRFKLVCECFVKGIMDGEATRDPKWSYYSRRDPKMMIPENQMDGSTHVKWKEIVLI